MILLNAYDTSFMLKKLRLTPDLRKALKASEKNAGKISDGQADNLRDCCTDLFDESGFDKEYKLTNDGEQLEALIDKLYTG